MHVAQSPWWPSVWEALLDALSVVLPVECAGCGTADRSLCAQCRGLLAVQGWRRELDGVPVFAAVSYEGAVRRSILNLKENGRTDVARALSRPLVQLLGRVVESRAVSSKGAAVRLLTVPPTPVARRRRGFDPVPLLLARAGLRPVRVLRRVRGSSAQKALTESERQRNRAGSLVASRLLRGARFVFVDDVVTSGATAREVIRAVREAGGEVVAVVALAATQRSDGRENSSWQPMLRGDSSMLGD